MNQKKILIIISIILALVSFVIIIKQDKPNMKDSFECIVDESDTLKLNYKVFVESSGSMKGYLNGETEFADVLWDLFKDIIESKTNKDINFYFIENNIVDQVQIPMINPLEKIKYFMDNLNKNVKGSTSDMATMIGGVIDSTKENDISLFISDCIFSPGKRKNPINYLAEQQNIIESRINKKMIYDSTDLSFVLLQYSVMFNGTYFNMEDRPTKLKDEKRPFYIWIIGNKVAINRFIKSVKVKHSYLKNKLVVLSASENKAFKIIPTPLEGCSFIVNNETKVIIDDKDTTKKTFSFREISKTKASSDSNVISFQLIVCLKSVYDFLNFVSDSTSSPQSIIENKENYEFSDPTFMVDKSIKSGNTAALITIKKSNITRVDSSLLELRLKYIKKDKWYEIISIEDDRNIKDNLDKTFGFKYLVNGFINTINKSEVLQTQKFIIKGN